MRSGNGGSKVKRHLLLSELVREPTAATVVTADGLYLPSLRLVAAFRDIGTASSPDYGPCCSRDAEAS
jgi:hypothetical protein